MSLTEVHCGYLPLVDSAPLIIAKDLDFAAHEGIDLTLMRQPSWSALRDRLAFGHIQVAHMLSPMPIATTLGLSGLQANIDALMVLSVNGTVIGVSSDLSDKMRSAGWDRTFDTPNSTSSALFAVGQKLRIGVPFPFSMHRMLLEYWLSRAPMFDPDLIEIITVPPPDMAEAVRNGRLDMFCVGEPWGSVAVAQSDAVLIMPGANIWQFAPEKVLGARRDWIETNPNTSHAMIRAVYKACKWLEQPENTPLAVEILARSQHLDLPKDTIDPALTHLITTQPHHAPVSVDRFIGFHEAAANFPWRSQACWIADYISQWHGLDTQTARDAARACFRSDLYRTVLGPMGVDLPGASEKLEGAMAQPTAVSSSKGQMILGPDQFFDGAVFDFEPTNPPKK